MHISSKAGTEIFKNEYQIIDGINGIPTLETDYSQLKYNHPEPMVMLSNAYDDRFIMIIKEQESVAESSRLRLTGVHSFIYDFSLDRIYEEYTQYFSLENILSLLFDGTDYTFEVKSDIYYYALDFQNFGDNDKMSLINQICDRWELEYHVTGNKVVFGQRRGRETTKQFRYKMNIADSSVNLDISEGATYIRAYFGKKDEENPENSTYTEREMTHPLVEEFGIRHAEPYSNENITQEETMQRYMKMKIEETWKLSVEIDVTELIGDGEAEVGNTVWAIDERMDLEYKTRIIELKRYYNKDDKVYKTKATLGNKTFIEAVSEQEVTQGEVEEVARYTNRLIENLKAQFDNDFNSERDALRQMVSDATDAAHAEIEASEERMTELIGNERASLQAEIDDKTNDAREYADAQIADKEAQYEADWNQRDADIQQTIETVVGGSVDALDTSLLDVNSRLLSKLDESDLQPLYGRIDDAFIDISDVSGELSTARSELQEQLDEARAELEGLEYENRNYVLNSNFLSGDTSHWIVDNTSSVRIVEGGYESDYAVELSSVEGSQVRLTPDVTLKPGTYTIQIWYKNVEGQVPFLETNGEFPRMTGFFKEGEGWQVLEFTRTIDYESKPPQIRYANGAPAENVEGVTIIGAMKIERGIRTTPHSIAPEDTEAKITTLSESIEYIDGQLEAKLNRTEIEPIQNKITEYGTTLDANAESISLLQDKTELHDDDITKWSNQTQSNAEEIGRALTRLSDIDGDIERAQTEISANADGISGLLTRVTNTETSIADIDISVDGITVDFANYKRDVDSDVGELSAQVASYEASVDGFRAEVSTLRGDINDVDGWIAEKGAVIDGNADAIRTRVWQQDIDDSMVGVEGRNYILNSDFSNGQEGWTGNVTITEEGALLESVTGRSHLIQSKSEIEPGEYTVQIWYRVLEGHAPYLFTTNGTDMSRRGENFNPTINEWQVLTNTITVHSKSRFYAIRYAGGVPADSTEGKIIIGKIMLNKGTKALPHSLAPEDTEAKITQLNTDITIEAGRIDTLITRTEGNETDISALEQTASSLTASVGTIQEDYLQKTDFILESDGFFLGGNYVGGDHYSTAIVGSANGIDILADEMRLTGDLLVQGDVEAYALNVVEGNFGRLWADEFSATTITGDHIDGNTITGRHLSVDSAMVDKLIADTAFANDIQTLSLNAVRGDIADLRSRLLTSDVITTDHIRWNNALFNRLTGDEAFIDRLEVKAANIRDLSAVDFVGNRITQSSRSSHTLEMYNGYLSSYNNGELNLRFGRYDLEFYNRSSEQIGWIGPSTHAYDPSRRGIALTIENDYFTLGIRRQGLIRPVLTTTQSGRSTVLSGPFGGALPGASLSLFANRRLVSTDTDYEVDASAIDQPSIIMDQSEDTNTMHQYFGGMNRRYGAIWQVRWRESSDSSSRRIEANDSGVILQGQVGITGNLYSLNSGNDYWENNSGSNTLSSSNSSFHVGGVRVRRGFSHLYLGTNNGGELRVTNGDGRNENGSGPIYRDIRFRNWTAVSSEKYKTDITEWDYSVLDVIKDEMSIYQYKYTDDDKSIDNAKDFYQRGLIVERNTPIEWIAGDGINQYEVTAWTLKGLQEVAHITDDHENRIEQLERENVELKQQLSELKGA